MKSETSRAREMSDEDLLREHRELKKLVPRLLPTLPKVDAVITDLAAGLRDKWTGGGGGRGELGRGANGQEIVK